MSNKNHKRYSVQISFDNSRLFDDRVAPINEKVKTLKEANEYKELIDDTVNRFIILDTVTNKIIYSYK